MRRYLTTRSLLALAGLALVTLACSRGGVSTPPIVHDYTATLRFAGLTRTYLVHLPHTYDGTHMLPLVLAFHGSGGTGPGMAALTNLNNAAEDNGFMAVYPDAINHEWSFGKLPALGGIDDVGFISALLDTLGTSLKLDPKRVYATGLSDGGFFAALLACQRADRIAALAEVGATMSTLQAEVCAPSHPMPALLIHGTADPVVAFSGGSKSGISLLSAPANAARWAALAGCAATPAVTTLPDLAQDGTSIVQSTYGGCQAGAAVIFDAVQDGGHTWPGGAQYLPVSYIGKTSHNLNASQATWNFFQQHPHP
jgi:polyhydroxybutyrate depolymerase